MNKIKEARQGRSVYIPRIEDIGMSETNIKKYKEALTSGIGGCYYITGPTGSGKTTTMYSTLIWLSERDQDKEEKFVTIEDDILCHLEHVSQVEGDPGQSSSFFKSIIRSDPDTIMLDSRTDARELTQAAMDSVQIATDSSLTGHKVLAPLYTSEALNYVARLKNMGVPSFLIAHSTNVVLNQRLLSTLCPECKEPVEFGENLFDLYKISAADYKKILSSDYFGSTVYRLNSNGCENCFYRGIQPKKDRVGVFEVIIIDDELREAIEGDAPMRTLTAIARRSGSKSLFEESLEKVYQGIIDPTEAARLSLLK